MVLLRTWTRFLLCVLAMGVATSQIEATDDLPEKTFETWGLEVSAANVERNVRFYREAFGFEIVQSDTSAALLRLDDLHLRITRGANAPRELKSGTYLNLMVKDLSTAAQRVRSAGGTIDNDTPQPFALGTLHVARDPAGHRVHLLLIPNKMDNHSADTAVFNVSIIVDDMEAAEAFYTELGFQVFSRDWLPETLPLMNCGGFSLVLHTREDAKQRQRTCTLVLRTPDIETARGMLPARSVSKSIEAEGDRGAKSEFNIIDPAGARLKVIAEPKRTLASERKH